MRGSMVVSFLYDTFKTRVRHVDLNESRSTVNFRLLRVIEDEEKNAEKFGWTLISHATTVLPDREGGDFLLFEVTSAKGRIVRTRVELLLNDTSVPVSELIVSGLNAMAEDCKEAGLRPVGHTVTLV